MIWFRKYFHIVSVLFLTILAADYNEKQCQNKIDFEPTNGPYGGDIRAILKHPEEFLLITTENGKVYKSLDNGYAWSKINYEFPMMTRDIGANRVGHIFLCFFNANPYVSTDLGESWNRIEADIRFSSFHRDTTNNLLYGGGRGKIYISKDDGSEWNISQVIDGNNSIYDIETDSNSYIYVTIYNTGIYKSTDLGETWNALPIEVGSNRCRELEIDDDNIFVTIEFIDDFSHRYSKIFKSINGGDTWVLIKETDEICKTFSVYENTIVLPTDEGLVYVSSNNGNNWSEISKKLTDINAIIPISDKEFLIGTQKKGVIRFNILEKTFVECNEGIQNYYVNNIAINERNYVFVDSFGNNTLFSTTNYGRTWEMPNFIGVSEIGECEDIECSSNYVFLAFSSDNSGGSIFRSVDHGNSFRFYTSIGKPYDLMINNNDELYICSDNGLYKANDLNSSFSKIYPSECWRVETNSEGDIILGCSDEVKISTDQGVTWSTTLTNVNIQNYTAIETDDEMNVYLGTRGTGFYKSTDGGFTWNLLSDSTSTVGSIVVLENEELYIQQNGYIYHSSNGGNSFTRVYSLGYVGETELAINTRGNIFVGNYYEGVFRSTDISYPVETIEFYSVTEGKEVNLYWHTIDDINNLGYSVFRKSKSEDNWAKKGFVSAKSPSAGGNIYTYKDSVTVSGDYQYYLQQLSTDSLTSKSEVLEVTVTENVLSNYKLYQNYPNPFNSSTTIHWQLPKTEHVTIEVFDILGAQVVELVNQRFESGYCSTNFDGRGLPSGVYIYKIRAGSFIDSKKMLLLK